MERLSRRRLPPNRIVTPELARTMTEFAVALRRQVGLLVDRQGNIQHMIVGDNQAILIPDLTPYRRGPGRLRGLRCLHVHLESGQGLSSEDLTDLALLRLDAMVAIEARVGLPGPVHVAHLLPPNPDGKQSEVQSYDHPSAVDLPFDRFIWELEAEIQRVQGARDLAGQEEQAILVHASPRSRPEAERSLAELAELSRSANVLVLKQVCQRIGRFSPAHLLGLGKLREILMEGLYLGATLVIFDQELTPVQVNNIARLVDLKVIDRTQLILDIFASRAKSREGKIQVELAQLRYLLPRLVGRGTAMSRLMGGIGGRGPGETKLEVDRRRIKQRITSLEGELNGLARGRRERRKRRTRAGLPVISIIGYTNVGKSTLLNHLTGSSVLVEDRLFATLDPTSRRLRLPDDRLALLADTVGFIRHMPKELQVAFRATLEELEEARLFLHVVDVTSAYRQEEVQAVNDTLEVMGFHEIPRIMVWNKIDLVAPEEVLPNCKAGVHVSAKTGKGLKDLRMALAGSLLVSNNRAAA